MKKVISKIKKLITHHASRITDAKGFTLIELAIVLVIIGIIIGAAMKGQDLIEGARIKKVSNEVNTFNNSVWVYLDRRGRLPGDNTNRNGLIGDVAGEQTAATSAIQEMETLGLTNLPNNPIAVGSVRFWVYYGFDAVAAGGNRSVAVICPADTCATAFTAEELKYIEGLDTVIDGISDAGLGRFRAATAVTSTGAGTTTGGRATRVVTAVTGVNETTAGATAAWATTHRAAVWLFDRPY